MSVLNDHSEQLMIQYFVLNTRTNGLALENIHKSICTTVMSGVALLIKE